MECVNDLKLHPPQSSVAQEGEEGVQVVRSTDSTYGMMMMAARSMSMWCCYLILALCALDKMMVSLSQL